jgi:hypothetical protein
MIHNRQLGISARPNYAKYAIKDGEKLYGVMYVLDYNAKIVVGVLLLNYDFEKNPKPFINIVLKYI